ncbi:Hexose carrier protein HEX6 [Bienertia sinuspersici]
MAVVAVISSGDNYNGKVTWFVIMSCMMAAMGGVLFGFDVGVSGGITSMEPFLRKFFPRVYVKMKEDQNISNYCKYDNQLLTLFTSSLYFAGLVASFFASPITKVYGRKTSILIGGLAFLAGSVLGGAALNIYMLILGRLLLGVGVGFSNQSVPLYLSEMAPPKYRGAFNNSFQLSVGIGFLAATLINFTTEKIKGGWGWRVSLASAAIPALILTVGALALPETPNSLIQRSSNNNTTNNNSITPKNDHLLHTAKLTLQRIRGTTDVDAELNDMLQASINTTNTVVISPKTYAKIMQRKRRPQLIMSIAMPFFQQVTGINVISFYAPILFRTLGLGESASLLSAVITGVVGICSTFLSMLIVDKCGRRALLIFGGALMFICQLAIGVILARQLGDHGGISKEYAYLVLVLICIYVAGFGVSWGPLGWLVPSEIFQLEIRSIGQSITVAVNFVFTFIVAQTFLAMLCSFKAGLFFFFGGWVFVMTGFVYLLLPETKGIPLEKIDQIWRDHWFWHRFVC